MNGVNIHWVDWSRAANRAVVLGFTVHTIGRKDYLNR